MNQPQPILSGALTTTPLSGLIVSITAQKLTGSLVIAENEQRLHCVAFRGGLAHKARLADQLDLIGQLLVDAGSLPVEFLNSVLDAAQESNTLFGQAALDMGMIQPGALVQALVYQTLRRAARLFALQTGTFGFYREDFLANFGDADSPQVDTLAILTTGVRASYDQARLTALLHDLEPVRLSTSLGEEQLARFRFTDEEVEVVQFLSAPRLLRELVLATGLPPQIIYGVVHCLQVTGQLNLEVAAAPRPAPPAPVEAAQPSPVEMSAPAAPLAPPSQPSAPQPAPAARSAPPPDPPQAEPTRPPPKPKPAAPEPQPSNEPKSERRLEAEALIAKGEAATYFELLGVPPTADSAEIQKAYVKRARQFHPDRATGDLAELRLQITELFARIGVARQTLQDPELRREYMATLEFQEEHAADAAPGEAPAPRLREEEIVEKLLNADEAFMKAKILLKRNKMDEAEELALTAAKADPEQGDYAALVAWIEAKKRPRGKKVGDLIDRLREAVKKVPKSEDANYYLAQLLYQEGRLREAFDVYDTVARINEHNIDAVRMIRILRRKLIEQKQQQKKPKEQSVGSIFGSLFGDKKK